MKRRTVLSLEQALSLPSATLRFAQLGWRVIRIEAVWLAVEPLDMRAGTEAALARVVRVFGAARPHLVALIASEEKEPTGFVGSMGATNPKVLATSELVAIGTTRRETSLRPKTYHQSPTPTIARENSEGTSSSSR